MQVDAFLVLKPGSDKLSGEATDTAIVKAIELDEFETGRGGNPADETDMRKLQSRGGYPWKYSPFLFQVRKEVDAATPHLFDAYCVTYGGWVVSGVNLFKSAEVSFRKAGGKATGYRAYSGSVYLKMLFENVLLVSYSLNHSGRVSPSETIKFVFSECKMEYQQQGVEGQTKPPPEMKGWSFAKNTPA